MMRSHREAGRVCRAKRGFGVRRLAAALFTTGAAEWCGAELWRPEGRRYIWRLRP